MAKVHRLSMCRLFDGLEYQQLEAIEKVGEVGEFEAGDTVFQEGDEGTHLFCVLKGRVEISVALSDTTEQAPVHVSAPGSVFGEFVLFEAVQRSATARTVKPSELFEVAAAELETIFQQDPVVGYRVMRNLCQILVGRVGKTTKELRASLMW